MNSKRQPKPVVGHGASLAGAGSRQVQLWAENTVARSELEEELLAVHT